MLLGDNDGVSDGISLGSPDGASLGRSDGYEEWLLLGDIEGTVEGKPLGDGEGAEEGMSDGASEGHVLQEIRQFSAASGCAKHLQGTAVVPGFLFTQSQDFCAVSTPATGNRFGLS